MNNDSNNLNQDNFNTQGNNGTPNNQPLNNKNDYINSQSISSREQSTYDVQQSSMQESNAQTINALDAEDNNNQINAQSNLTNSNSFNQNIPEQHGNSIVQSINSSKVNETISFNDREQLVENNHSIDAQLTNTSKKKTNIGLIIGIVIAIVIVALGIVILLFKLSNKNENEKDLSNSFKNDKINWKIVVNGKQYKIPTSLTEFTNNGFYFDDYYGELKDQKLDDFTQSFLRNSPEIKWYDKEYVPYPDAGFDSYGSLFELYLVHKINSSNDYKNYKVAGFNVTNISSQFFSVNGVGCGSTIDELVSALKIDTNSENYNRGDGFIEYLDIKNNIAITAYTPISGDDKIYNINIFINDREYLKK